MKKTFLLSLVLALSGCVSTESQVRNAIAKNPDIVFGAIEADPQKFIEVVNRAAQAAQKRQYEEQVAEMKRQQEEDIKNPRRPALDSKRRLSGTDSGKIVLVEYADFQCPACGMGHADLKKFKEKYKDKVQFYYKNMPLDFHEMAYPSATYYEAIFLQDRAKAEKFYETVFENQKDLRDETYLKKVAKQVGADLTRLAKDIRSDEVKKRIRIDEDEFHKFGFTGTPVIILNGVALNGAQRFEDLERTLALTEKVGEKRRYR